jgi:hypothetical protein
MARKYMAKGIMIDEYHLTVLAPRDLPERRYQTIRQTLDGRGFQRALRRAVRAVIRQYPSLDKVRMRLSR